MIDRDLRNRLVTDLALFSIPIASVLVFGRVAERAFLDRVASIAEADAPIAATIAANAARGRALFVAAVVLVAFGRAFSLVRGRDAIRIPFLLPLTLTIAALAFVVHQATFDLSPIANGTALERLVLPSSDAYAEGLLLGAIASFVILASPIDPASIALRATGVLAASVAAIFVALALVGSGPAGSGTRINLGPIQPIEAAKPLFVFFLAAYLGRRAVKLRFHRQRWFGLSFPRLTLLVPALVAFASILAGLFVVHDLGPVTILAGVFLAMFYVVTRASGWVIAALAIVVGIVRLAIARPDLVSVGRVVTRIRMWSEPFTNEIAFGDQLGEGMWATAAGGTFGRGLAANHAPLVAAGKTDLVLATTAEQLGAIGVGGYTLAIGVVVLTGCYVASRTRTPERVLLAIGASTLLLLQWAVIHGGTFGTIPLTGVVVPFLSSGRSSLVAFLALVAVIARIAEDGVARAETDELAELRGGVRAIALVAVVLVGQGVVASVSIGILDRHAISARPIATRLGDGSIVLRSNPRLLAIARSLRRGTIADRNGAPLAVASESSRRYPLGRDLGTLLGVHPSRVLLPPWALERRLDDRLRGYGRREWGARRRVGPDLSRFAPLLDRRDAALRREVRAIDADLASRSVRLTIDARLQLAAAEVLRRHVDAGDRVAAAAVILDVDSGETLARVQVPDLDPNDSAWLDAYADGEDAFVARFTGAYGEWPDKTGIRGYFQAGSIGKLFTALAAVRSGSTRRGEGCAATTDRSFACSSRDADGPRFELPGWSAPIHDHAADPTHGTIDLPRAIGESCNVYFGQLALALGPEPFLALRTAGVDIGALRDFRPGAPGSRELASTGFGQGAMAMNVLQAARLVAAIAHGGRYRRCGSTMELGARCEDHVVVDDPRSLEPILAGMRRVMIDGTGRRLAEPEGLRIYGKTGTADVAGFEGEEPFGIVRGATSRPHSWFVALVEPASAPSCTTNVPGRLAIAVVVPRGGSGAGAAGPIAMELAARANELGYVGPR